MFETDFSRPRPRPYQMMCRVTSTESGIYSAPRGWGMGRVSLPQPTRKSGEHCELSQRGPGHILAGNAFLCIFKSSEHSFLHLYMDALSSSNNILCHIWGKGWGLWGEAIAPCPNVERPCFFITIFIHSRISEKWIDFVLLCRCWHKVKVLFCPVWHGHGCTKGCWYRKWTRI